MSSRRDDLARAPYRDCAHAGLWFDRYATIRRNDKDAQRNHVAAVASIPMPRAYVGEQGAPGLLQRWRQTLDRSGARTYRGTSITPAAVGLGDASVIETGARFHHTYGVPYLPGNALKGLASSYAHRRLGGSWSKGGADHEVAFGTTRSAGYVTFHDALPERYDLRPDVMTPHHSTYYQGNDPPADWDSPTPIPYLTFTGEFLFALAGPDRWVEEAANLLALALREFGIGAKTSSGYGRLELHGVSIAEAMVAAEEARREKSVADIRARRARIAAEAEARQAELDAVEAASRKKIEAKEEEEFLATRLASLTKNTFKQEIGTLAKRLTSDERGLPAGVKQEIAQAMLGRVREIYGNKVPEGKRWYQDLRGLVETP